jgi:hypothetical protein
MSSKLKLQTQEAKLYKEQKKNTSAYNHALLWNDQHALQDKIRYHYYVIFLEGYYWEFWSTYLVKLIKVC